MLHFFELSYHCIQPGCILISERIRGISAAKVYIVPAIGIGYYRTAGMIDDHIVTVICMYDILSIQFFDMAAVHQTLLSLL